MNFLERFNAKKVSETYFSILCSFVIKSLQKEILVTEIIPKTIEQCLIEIFPETKKDLILQQEYREQLQKVSSNNGEDYNRMMVYKLWWIFSSPLRKGDLDPLNIVKFYTNYISEISPYYEDAKTKYEKKFPALFE